MSATLREAVSNARALLERAKAWPTCKHVRRDPHTYGCLDCGGAPSEDEWKSTVEALVEATSTTPPTVPVADLAAVVEDRSWLAETSHRVVMETQGKDYREVRMRLVHEGAREVLRRVTGGEVPRVLLESRVVEVLTDVLGQREGIQRTHFMQVDMDEAEPLGNGWERAIREAGRMLGLTLPTGPGGGETTEAEPRTCYDGGEHEPMRSEPHRCVYGEHDLNGNPLDTPPSGPSGNPPTPSEGSATCENCGASATGQSMDEVPLCDSCGTALE